MSAFGPRAPDVSVLIPSYNLSDSIGHAIESVLSQRDVDLELVISDDASTDGSHDVISQHDDPRIVYVQQARNLGMVSNWRACVNLSTGRNLLLLGADDYLLPGMLAACVRVLDRHPNVAFCHTAVEIFDERGVVDVTGVTVPSYIAPGREVLEGFILGRRVANSAAVFRRRCFEEVGGWSDDYRNCMDLDLWFRMLLRWDVAYISKVLVGFRRHAISEEWRRMQSLEDVAFTEHMFMRLPTELEHLLERRGDVVWETAVRGALRILESGSTPEDDAAIRMLESSHPGVTSAALERIERPSPRLASKTLPLLRRAVARLPDRVRNAAVRGVDSVIRMRPGRALSLD